MALLAELRQLFDRHHKDRLPSALIVSQLRARDGAPWSDWPGGFSPTVLAELLRPFGIRRRTLRFDARQAKGYLRADFERAWTSYSP